MNNESNKKAADNDRRILVLGIGNYLMGDEGIGVHLARTMAEMTIPGVDVLDGGTGGLQLLEYLEQYPHVIIVDATLDGLPEGTIRSIKPRYASDFPPAMSTHDIGLKDLVGALQLLNRMPDIDLYVVSINNLQMQSVELSAKLAATLPKLVEMLVERIGSILQQEVVDIAD